MLFIRSFITIIFVVVVVLLLLLLLIIIVVVIIIAVIFYYRRRKVKKQKQFILWDSLFVTSHLFPYLWLSDSNLFFFFFNLILHRPMPFPAQYSQAKKKSLHLSAPSLA